jgi:hypothetical protein
MEAFVFEAAFLFYGLVVIFCCIQSYQKTWKFFFLFNIGIGIPFYGGALLATLLQLIPGEMGLRVMLFYFIGPVLNAAKRGQLLDSKSRRLIWLSFIAFWGIGFWLTPLGTMCCYLLLIIVYFFVIERKIRARDQAREKI